MGQRTYGTTVPAGVLFYLLRRAPEVTRMTTWNVHVRGAGIAAGVQLDFCLDGFTDHEAVPPLAAGDGLTFIFPSNDRVSGVVLGPDSDKGTIEAG